MALYLWGSGYENQLGVGKDDGKTDLESEDFFKGRWVVRRPLRLDLCGARAVDVACGEAHTLVCTEFGEVLSCGRGKEGQLGRAKTEDAVGAVDIREHVASRVFL